MCAKVAINEACDTDKAPFFGAVCLLGLGITCQAVVEYFLENPQSLDSLIVYVGASTPEARSFAARLPADIVVHLDCEDVEDRYDTAVVSTGISPASRIYQSARDHSRELISEPELAWRISPQNWIAITGTNGKTTVTELTAHLLNSAGLRARVAGNIGTSCVQVARERRPGDYLVAELSSYQLHSISELAPDMAVLLNITPDHLHWHGSFAGYATDKLRILQNLAAHNPAVIDATLPETRAVVRQLRREGRRVIALGTSAGIHESMAERCGAAEAAYVSAESGELLAIVQGQRPGFGAA